MKWIEFVHVLRAAHDITGGETDFVVVGSQSILGTVSNPPKTMLTSCEVDLYLCDLPDDFEQINGTLGEFSRFYQTNGYYADAVDIGNIRLPKNWKSRLIYRYIKLLDKNDTTISVGFLSMEDTVASKLYAGRAKDLEYISEAKRCGLINTDLLFKTLDEMELGFDQYDKLLDLYNSL